MYEDSTVGRYKFHCDGFTVHFDTVMQIYTYVQKLKHRHDISGKEYQIWDKSKQSSAPVKVGVVS